MIRPTPLEWIIASRYTLIFWLGLAAYIWFGWGGDWEALAQEQQLALVIGGGMFAVAYLKSFHTVFFYERENALRKAQMISPEEKWRRQTVAQTFFLVLLAAGLIYWGVQWWKSEPAPQTTNYKAASIGIGGASVLATTAYLKVRTWRSASKPTEQPAIVSWCLPVPTHSPTQAEIYSNLPDYCQSLLVSGEKRSPAIDNDQLRFADTRTQNTHA